MNRIIYRENLNDFVTLMKVDAELVAKKAKPGQFVILRAEEDGERIPLTIADYDRAEGSVTIIFQIVGATTEKLNRLGVGDYIVDLAGPLGRATETSEYKSVAVIGGGVGSAIALPIAKQLYNEGAAVYSIAGFRSRELVILEDRFREISDKYILMTDDGSAGEKGLVTDALKVLIESGIKLDCVIAIGPLIMMKFVCLLTKKYGIKTIISMNPIMIDGTGMCGGCRLTVGGETKFACVDGPDFDGHLVDFDEAMARSAIYKNQERSAHDDICNLFKKEADQ
ncbi:MAG: sulfide/dihydroorotate dehydrogenase-like FAD/NAD-binding protein [Eubacteriales bacterium]